MDNESSLITLIVVGVIVVGVFVFIFILMGLSLKHGNDESESMDSADTSSTKKTIRSDSEEGKTTSSSQVIIYAFKAKNETTLCPYCDGENSIGATVCDICRRDL